MFFKRYLLVKMVFYISSFDFLETFSFLFFMFGWGGDWVFNCMLDLLSRHGWWGGIVKCVC